MNVAQLVEPRIVVPVVVGSSPIVHPIIIMLFIISGPSGVGKGTLIKVYLKKSRHCVLSTSATTRMPRIGEVNGNDYYFKSNSEFDTHIKNNDFLEWCTVHTNRYGTLKSDIKKKLTSSPAVIVEIDVQGAKKIKQHTDFPQHHIFIAPPSLDVLEQRLRTRNTEDEANLMKRLKQANQELLEQSNYDSIIVNNELTQSTIELDNVVLSILTKGVTQ